MMYFLSCLLAAFLTSVNGDIGRTIPMIGNPVTSPSDCAQSKPSYVCDPDGLLTDEGGNVLDKAIRDVISETSCPCSPQECVDDEGYRIGIALIQKMVINNEVHSVNEDATGEGSLARKLRAQLATARNYASSLLNTWQLGRCKESVLVFCSQDEAMCYTAVDTTAGKKLTDGIVGEIAASSQMRTGYNLTARLMNMVHDYKLVFLGKYNRTTNWRGRGPEEGRLVFSSQPTLHIPAPHLTALLAFFVLLFVTGPRYLRLVLCTVV